METDLQRKSGLPAQDYRDIEQEFRKYVRRTGGLRKGLSASGKAEADRLAKLLRREVSTGWDQSLHIESPNHIEKLQKANQAKRE